MTNAETWETTSGLADDFDCTVIDAWWATDPRYNNGQTALLFWKIETDDESVGDEFKDGGIRFSAGADWESLDGGETVEHASKTKFNKNSGVGQLIVRAIELGAGDALMERGPSQRANVWVGTSWHMKSEEQEFTIQGETKKRDRLLPDKFLGADGEGAPTSSGTSEAEEPAAPSIDLDPALRETLVKIKADTPSHNAFVDKAMELTEVQGNVTLVTAIATPDGIYKEL